MSQINLPLGGLSPADLIAAAPPPGARADRAGTARDDAKLVQAAKDFKSVLLHKVMEEMRNTIPDSGLLEDGGMGQIQGMFWSFLAKDVADKGGIGLWKDLYDQWSRIPPAAAGGEDRAEAAETLP